ncbi:hypothetical protein AGABI1DRAFT_128707 [Agaricus bisporus var. burnettii JB137-S8]|uniref:BTB domain-containing protein n=1 Tax=Agaricus bisporus var. burnettii (strain JB137-S8 / ATCC MYA-4627 / FGSC 10392) TaxID=597362 RepID=K5XWF6_AGABU|nr:uncharacterized protein AGABI1DRAFT_128707 [Agaricus bisporus var. burnettii JB137-S8]EKM79560.1 hypothetical protein AGABI1DRAFT_128707 [Agaricus bisporus var. burnettii JB137-S8]
MRKPSSKSPAPSIAVAPESHSIPEDPVSENETQPIVSSVIRDEDYYWHDGNCAIRVKDRLFKLHRYLLERDSVIFRILFTLPQSDELSDDEKQTFTGQGVDGQSDEDPIICDDSIEDFKALCWMLYAGPKEISAQEKWKTMDMTQLLRVIVISDKYGFENLRAWSLNVVEQNFWPKSSEFVDSCGGWKNIERLLVICHDCQQYTLTGRIEQFWLDEIKKPDQHGTSEQLETFKAALDAAENHPFLRPFHGKAYYAYLQTCNVFNVTLEECTVESWILFFDALEIEAVSTTGVVDIRWSFAHKQTELDPAKFLQLQRDLYKDPSFQLCPCSRKKMEAKVQTVINWFDNSLSDQFKIPLCDEKERSEERPTYDLSLPYHTLTSISPYLIVPHTSLQHGQQKENNENDKKEDAHKALLFGDKQLFG